MRGETAAASRGDGGRRNVNRTSFNNKFKFLVKLHKLQLANGCSTADPKSQHTLPLLLGAPMEKPVVRGRGAVRAVMRSRSPSPVRRDDGRRRTYRSRSRSREGRHSPAAVDAEARRSAPTHVHRRWEPELDERARIRGDRLPRDSGRDSVRYHDRRRDEDGGQRRAGNDCWTHDRFIPQVDSRDGGREQRRRGDDDDSRAGSPVADPYSGHVRASRAYQADSPPRAAEARRADPPPRRRSPSPPAYEWKSRAGGVAIFARQPMPVNALGTKQVPESLL